MSASFHMKNSWNYRQSQTRGCNSHRSSLLIAIGVIFSIHTSVICGESPSSSSPLASSNDFMKGRGGASTLSTTFNRDDDKEVSSNSNQGESSIFLSNISGNTTLNCNVEDKLHVIKRTGASEVASVEKVSNAVGYFFSYKV